MRNFLTLAGALALSLGLISANAGAITHTLTLNATVQAGCTVNAATGTAGFSVNGATSTFTTAVTGTTQAPASGTLTFGSLICTTNAAKVTLASTRLGLYVTGTEGNSLAKRMNYSAAAKLNSTTLVTLDTVQGIASKNGQAILSTSSTNNIFIDITFPGTVTELIPNGALTAGTYTDTLTINIDGVTI
jgi:hypothetical protein